MFKTLLEKELKSILLSPKFAAVFAVCSILIILSIYVGIDEYRTAVDHYDAVNSQLDAQKREETNWGALRENIVRRPDPMEIFVAGINNDIGRQCPIHENIVIKLYGSRYSDQLLFSVFRSMDLMFIVQIVLSLFAILFTYDAVCGEREAGTLKLNFSNSVPRTSYILAKIAGSWLGLVIPLLIPILLGIALVLIYRIPVASEGWWQLFLLIGISILYFSFFVCLGVFLSSVTRTPSASFLYLLVIWICFVLVIPRAGVMAAGQFINVQPAAEIISKLTEKRRQTSEKLNEWYTVNSKKRDAEIEALDPEVREKKGTEIHDQFYKDFMEEDTKYTLEVDNYYTSLIEDWRNRKGELEKLGFMLSRLSPASAYQLAAMNIAGTGLSLKSDYEDQLHDYKAIYSRFCAQKNEESRKKRNTAASNKPEPIDISELPVFEFNKPGLTVIIQSSALDAGILIFFIFISIAGAFISFNRYDVR